MKRISSIVIALLILTSVLTISFNIQLVKSSDTIYIRADGSIDPPTANIITTDNITYTFTDDNHASIYVERDSITIDGAGYTLQAIGSMFGFNIGNVGNVTIQDTNIKDFYYGIRLDSSSNNVISGNNITNTDGGILIHPASNNNTLFGNNITNSQWGISLHESSNNIAYENHIIASHRGVSLQKSSYNTVSRNCIVANLDAGIFLHTMSDNNKFLENIVKNSNRGFYMGGSANNIFSGNHITNNSHGFWLWLGSPTNNTIYHNNFINNASQVYIETPGYSVSWDDGYPSGGNYWDDYTDVDLYSGPYQNETGSDSIWDHPYVIDTDNEDRYPLVKPWTTIPAEIGWLHLGYDLNNTNHYPKPSEMPVALENFNLTWESPNKGAGIWAHFWAKKSAVLTGDINGDGALEIMSASEEQLCVVNKDGTTLWERNVTVDSGIPGAKITPFGSIDLADVDGDGFPEIAVAVTPAVPYPQVNTPLRILFYDGNGNLLKTITPPDSHVIDIRCADLDSDGNAEVIATIYAWYTLKPRGVYVYDYNNGSELWHYDVGPQVLVTAISDINNDGNKEIILGSFAPHNGNSDHGTDDAHSYVFAFDKNGNNLWTTLIGTDSVISAVSDLENDGVTEIISFQQQHANYYPGSNDVHILNANGSFRHSYSGPTNVAGAWTWSIADINNDGNKEIIASHTDAVELVVLSHNLTLLNQVSIEQGVTVQATNDLSGDGRNEVIVSASTNRLAMLNTTLAEIWNYTLAQEGAAIVSDLNQDGVNEIVVSADKLYSFSLSLEARTGSFIFPLKGTWTVNRIFGKWYDDFQDYHLGEDVLRDSEVPVFAPANGIVKWNENISQYGYVLVIEHQLLDGTYACSVLGHLKRDDLASVGSEVAEGQVVGRLSSLPEENGGYNFTHLHFGIRKGRYSTELDRDGGWRYRGYGPADIVYYWYPPSEFINWYNLHKTPNLPKEIGLEVAVTSNKTSYDVGEKIEFEVNITNPTDFTGINITAYNVVVTVDLPEEIELDNPQACYFSEDILSSESAGLVVSLGDILVGESASLFFNATAIVEGLNIEIRVHVAGEDHVLGVSMSGIGRRILSIFSSGTPEPSWSFAIITDLHIGYDSPRWDADQDEYTIGEIDYGEAGWDESSSGEDYDVVYNVINSIDKIISVKERYNIKFVAVLGDISDTAEKSEFLKARELLNRLNDPNGDGYTDDGIPYVPLFGNHDPWPYAQDTLGADDRYRYSSIASYAKGDRFFKDIFWDESNSDNKDLIDEVFGDSWEHTYDHPVTMKAQLCFRKLPGECCGYIFQEQHESGNDFFSIDNDYRTCSLCKQDYYLQNYGFTYDGITFVCLDTIPRLGEDINPMEGNAIPGSKKDMGFIVTDHSETLEFTKDYTARHKAAETKKIVLFSHYPLGILHGCARDVNYKYITRVGGYKIYNFFGHWHLTGDIYDLDLLLQNEYYGVLTEDAGNVLPGWFTSDLSKIAEKLGFRRTRETVRIVQIANNEIDFQATLKPDDIYPLKGDFPPFPDFKYTAFASYPEPGKEIVFTADYAKYHGFNISFNWDFGDGGYDSGLCVGHTYFNDGEYNVTLTVTSENMVTYEKENLTITRSIYVHKKHVISSLPPNLTAISPLTGEDLTQTAKNTYEPVVISKNTSQEIPITNLGVHFEITTDNINLSGLVADVKVLENKSMMYMSSWPEEIQEYKWLYIPSTGKNYVYICLDVTSIDEVNLENADLIIKTGETINNITVTTTNYGGREYHFVCGKTAGFGGGELQTNWITEFIEPRGYPIADFTVYNRSLYATADKTLYMLNGSSWTSINAPTFILSLESWGDQLVVGGKGGLYTYDGTNFTLVFTVPNYIKSLGSYNSTLYAGTVLDNPPTLYYCNGSVENPADWHVDTTFSAILNSSGTFGSIDSFEIFNDEMYVASGNTVYSFNGTIWTTVETFNETCAFLDMKVYNGKLYLATRDQGWRKPAYWGYPGFSGRVIEYDGTNWTTILDHDYWIFSLETYNNKLYVGTANQIFAYNGTDWETSFHTEEGAFYAVSMIVYDGKIYAGMGNGYILEDPQPETTQTETVVVPEFPSFTILPVLMIFTLLGVILARKKHLRFC